MTGNVTSTGPDEEPGRRPKFMGCNQFSMCGQSGMHTYEQKFFL